MSRPHVTPVDVEGVAPGVLADQPDGVRLNDVPGKPGTLLGLGLRCVQFVCSTIALACMACTNFTPVPAFRFLVGMSALNSAWSLALALADIYAFLVNRRLRNHRLDRVFTIGDGIVGFLVFMAASASGGFSHRINELDQCATRPCAIFNTSTVFAFISVFALSPCFFLNFSSWMKVV